MKSGIIIATVLTGALAHPVVDHFHTWSPPGPGDVRGPCPGLNSLANHGFLPHDGKNIDLNTTIAAFANAINGASDFATSLFMGALMTNLRVPNPTTFDLTDLDNHDIIEHDASLSRGDAYFGNDHTFNKTIYDQTTSYWTGETIDIQMAANARAARIATSKATNPTFNQTYMDNKGFGEPTAYFMALGHQVPVGNETTFGYTYEVKRSFVKYLFEHERLPVKLGWRPSSTLLTLTEFGNTMHLIAAASPPGTVGLKGRGLSIHGSNQLLSL
ncbi:Cloroperoxidase [Mollisia scopiformis]|uniref:Cloroperoxidase n=1 Tax=Mollisia scopiformis TaxID=149040 RepID=A0A132BBD2_MOLSC|nr:Cloroperoxidase [Mollisia scopiformis]KUJ08957.1 Cloroperoxidase [Mollisia scopiformis]